MLLGFEGSVSGVCSSREEKARTQAKAVRLEYRQVDRNSS